MPDPRFFTSAGPFSVSQLASVSGAQIGGDAQTGRIVRDVAPLEKATASDLSFLDNTLYLSAFSESAAGVCVVHPERSQSAPDGMTLLLSEAPYLAYALIANAFYPEKTFEESDTSCLIDPTAVIGKGTYVAPGAVIGPRAEIGAKCVIGANSVIGAGVVIGNESRIGPCVSVHYSKIGSKVRLYAGSRIGEAGFGFATGNEGHVTVPQLGRVIIGDGTEVGANTTIDRGSAADTVIGEDCRIDNLVQIGHNVILGRGCIVVSQVGISGSTHLDDYVVVGGQVGFTGHLKIGKGVQIAAQSGVMNDLPAGGKYSGSPAVPMRQWLKQAAMIRSMGKKKASKDG